MGFQNFIEELNTAHAVFIDENQVNLKIRIKLKKYAKNTGKDKKKEQIQQKRKLGGIRSPTTETV